MKLRHQLGPVTLWTQPTAPGFKVTFQVRTPINDDAALSLLLTALAKAASRAQFDVEKALITPNFPFLET
jgi:hypothetical protein